MSEKLLSRLRFFKRKLTAPLPVIGKGAVSVFDCPEGFKIFRNKEEITKNCGLGLSWSDSDDKMSDLTETDKINLHWGCKSIGNIYKTDTSEIICTLELNDQEYIDFTIRYSFKIAVNSLKITLFLSEQFTYWILDYHEGIFPRQHSLWQNVPTPEKDGGTAAGARNKDSFPVIVLEAEKFCHFLENSDTVNKSRVLCAVLNNPDTNGIIKGSVKFLDENSFSSWLKEKRERILLNN